MNIKFTPTGWGDYSHWQANDAKILNRVNDLIRDICRDPFKGIGKPEALKGNLSGYWSRRITDEHRIVYRIETTIDSRTKKSIQNLCILQVRYHY
ncbi:Txe/YoeB family addiction module toxin [Chryseolinea lacunae]|uniref:Putative mRNA interferase YoeB n=1 Tax=Chryseolinea lacunae TaxID=2801331 RepID=A0ABS1KNM1_9BACT|nr:Txe/YoeB family addiction module toxin [Chryseolinea lacunae]MBL0740287.1 Txe/YoeB family addiction module toxin [Chryseolinea lacunae]